VDTFSELSQFRALARELLPGSGDCPFVVEAKQKETVLLRHFSGGRDAAYVVISKQRNEKPSANDVSVMIRYAPFVEGTTIIYDATAETMQGKARPFVCRLSHPWIRVYAVMPFQVEDISLRSDSRRMSVAFLDAGRERIAAALPFELRLVDAGGQVLSAEYRSTDRSGHFTCDAARARRAIVRSLLSGREESLKLESHTGPRD
jgi:hypothetical protein